MKTILVIDGQGGGCGRSLIEKLAGKRLDARIVATGTNAAATAAMLRAGASAGATGENAILVNCRRADVIPGPIGIVLADALMGECSPAIAAAVGAAQATKVLIPVSRCGAVIAGLPEQTLADSIEAAAQAVEKLLKA